MEPREALDRLTEISSQVRAAVIADADGGVIASTVASDDAARRLARAARELIAAADRHGRASVVQLDAATPEGNVFVVRHGDRLIAATTGPEPTVGLVFYDLRSCLRSLRGDEENAAP
jgi:predicted regulator of Ras-like GTPase activity (Roadblock/LC7/MglB family)